MKEMESFISGKDRRDLHDIIHPQAITEYHENKDGRCKCHSTGDSGFSGSVQPDDAEETRGILDGKSSYEWTTRCALVLHFECCFYTQFSQRYEME